MSQSIQITEDSPLLHDANCVYCHADLELGDQVVVCDSCRSPHHADCWGANHSQCAMFGCHQTQSRADHNSHGHTRGRATQQASGRSAQPDLFTTPESIVNEIRHVEDDASFSSDSAFQWDSAIGFVYFVTVVIFMAVGTNIWQSLFGFIHEIAMIFIGILSFAVPFVGINLSIRYFRKFFS